MGLLIRAWTGPTQCQSWVPTLWDTLNLQALFILLTNTPTNAFPTSIWGNQVSRVLFGLGCMRSASASDDPAYPSTITSVPLTLWTNVSDPNLLGMHLTLHTCLVDYFLLLALIAFGIFPGYRMSPYPTHLSEFASFGIFSPVTTPPNVCHLLFFCVYPVCLFNPSVST